MIDGIKIQVPKQAHSDFRRDGLANIGNNQYRLLDQVNGFSTKRIIIRETANNILIQGSIPYSINGNSFEEVSTESIQTYFGELSDRINMDVFTGQVKNFEAGVVVEVPFKYKEFHFNHVGVPGMHLVNDKTYSKVYSDEKYRSVKLYDAGHRLRDMVSKEGRTELEERGIYDSRKNYVKYEVVYHKPLQYYNTPSITLAKLLTEDFTASITNDLLNTYKTINKTGFEVNVRGAELDVPTIMGICLKKLERDVGIDVNAMVMESLDVYADRYSADGKSKRKKNIRTILSNLQSDNNPTNIYHLIQAKLIIDKHP